MEHVGPEEGFRNCAKFGARAASWIVRFSCSVCVPDPSQGKRASEMAACAAAVSSSLTIALSCLRSRAPFCTAARTFLAPAVSASSSSPSSSVFGKCLGGSVLGFALGNSASSTAVRGMETVNASAAQVQSGSSIYDFVVKVLLRRTHEELLPFPSLACSGI